MVVMQVREQDGVHVLPVPARRGLAAPPQKTGVPPEQRIGEQTRPVDVEDDARVAQPRHLDAHGTAFGAANGIAGRSWCGLSRSTAPPTDRRSGHEIGSDCSLDVSNTMTPAELLPS